MRAWVVAPSYDSPMFRIDSEQVLEGAFRPRDRRSLELPPAATYPILVRDTLAWLDAAGIRAYLVFLHESGKPVGLTFRRDQDPSAPGAANLCDWCHTWGPEVGLLTAEKNSKRRLGVLVCRDLRCPARLDEAADLAGTSSVEPKRQMLERVRRFAREGLGIVQVP